MPHLSTVAAHEGGKVRFMARRQSRGGAGSLVGASGALEVDYGSG